MKVIIAAIGRMKSGPEADLVETYLNRASQQGRAAGISQITVSEFAESRKPSATARKDEEAGWLTSAAAGSASIISLDETGKPYTSQQFAGIVRDELDSGTQSLVFCIGGPDGHGQALKQAAKHTICLGRLTWPHKLARVLLCEQIYRAVTILMNHPYHRE